MGADAFAQGEYYFDEDAARRVLDFFPLFLQHFEGEWAGTPFYLSPWQERFVWNVFGWKRLDGFRKYSTAYQEIPRKNGKSTFAAGLGVYMTGFDGEPGAQVFCAANDKNQARIVFEVGKKMIQKSPELAPHFECVKNAITHPASMSAWAPLSSDSGNKDGLNVHAIVIDELHALTDRNLYDVLTTASGSRRQPLTLIITTAGEDLDSICYQKHEYARQIIEGVFEDPHFYASIYAADKDDDWKDPKTWEKANPNYGISVYPDYYLRELREAMIFPDKEAAFKRLFLNIWGQSSKRWLPSDLWDRNAGWYGTEEESLVGRKSFWGLDLASVGDIAAIVGVFPPASGSGAWRTISRFFCPGARIRERSKKMQAPYERWVEQGALIATDGDSINFNTIQAEVLKCRDRFDMIELGYDRWNAAQIITNLKDEGVPVVPYGMGFKDMNPAAKHVEKLLLDTALWHGGHPVMRWMAGNVAIQTDPAGNIKPDKEKSREKIDGIVALCIGVGRAIVHPEFKSVYETRGILTA